MRHRTAEDERSASERTQREADLVKKAAVVETSFWEAVHNLDTSRLRKAIDQGADVNLRFRKNGRDYGTALHDIPYQNASEPKKLAVAMLLIERGADINALGQNNDTPLGLAVGARCVGITAMLLRAGAKPEDRILKQLTYRDGHTQGSGPILWELLNHQDPCSIDVQDYINRNEARRAEPSPLYQMPPSDWSEAVIKSCSDDDLAKCLTRIAEATVRDDFGPLGNYDGRRRLARLIGEELCRRGGLPKMKSVLETCVAPVPGQRTIDQFWDGIGGWMG